jgi:transglutaminase-like putative cysteine protease
VIILIAWNSPALANTISPISNLYQAIERPWNDAKERMSYLFASLRATVGLITDYYAAEQPLGTGNTNSDSPVMQITAPRVDFPGQRYYWRARTYDFYDEGTWVTTIEDEINFDPSGGDLAISDGGERTIVEVEITPRSALITLYGPTQPLWFSKAGSMDYVLTDGGNFDIVHMKASPFIRSDEPYTVRASLATITLAELREAGTDYPQWVVDRYLQIPEDITPRTRLLAQRLAEGRDNAYDIAATMTVWLRENIEYVEFIDNPPGGQEPLDWFLFDYRKGFCNYYSSSMVIMLRSLGIPARWAVGYAQGNQIGGQAPDLPDQLRGQVPEIFYEDEETYNVRQLDAHAWPEVYFPGIGWIEFEPTVSQIPLFRPSGLDPFDNNEENPLGGGSTQPEDLPIPDDFMNIEEEFATLSAETDSSRIIVVSLLSGVLGLGVIFLLIFSRRNPQRWANWWERLASGVKTPLSIQLEFGFHRMGIHPPGFLRQLAYQARLPIAAKSFLEVNKAITRLGLSTISSLTPSERVAALAQRVPDLASSGRELLNEYHQETYGNEKPDEYIVTRAGRKIKERSWQIWRQTLLEKIKFPFNRRISLRR